MDPRYERTQQIPSNNVDFVVMHPDLPNAQPQTCTYQTRGYTALFERKSADGAGSRQDWKSFEHYRKTISGGDTKGKVTITVDLGAASGNTFFGQVDGDPLLFYPFDDPGQPQPPLCGELEFYTPNEDQHWFVPYPVGLPELQRAALNAMLPRIKGNLSILNSLYELKDFRSLPKTLAGLYRTLRYIPQNLTLRQFARKSSDVYLQEKFNIMPLISDVVGIRQAISRTTARINALVAREGRVQVSHYSRDVLEVIDAGPSEALVGGYYFLHNGAWYHSGVTSKGSRYTITEPSHFHAQVKYNFNYTDYQRQHAALLAFLDAIGVNSSAAIIWNAIPWSFVIDWVAGVSQYLNNNRVGFMDPKINILGYLWSIKRKRTTYANGVIHAAKQMSASLPEFTSPVTYAQAQETAYRRESGMIDRDSVLQSGLNPTEFSLGAALVIPRLTHRRRKNPWRII